MCKTFFNFIYKPLLKPRFLYLEFFHLQEEEFFVNIHFMLLLTKMSNFVLHIAPMFQNVSLILVITCVCMYIYLYYIFYIFIKKNPTRCSNVSKFYYYIFIWSSTCFGRHTAHHQETKTALAASGFSYMEGCWTCSLWTLSGIAWLTSTTYTSNNLPCVKNQRLSVQFWAPDNVRYVARNMLSFM
jgi:hypothetical protein